MPPSPQELTAATTDAAIHELNTAQSKITHCLNQLSEEQVWWRPTESINSIANLILHFCGNVRQWIIAGVGGAEDTRNRPQRFSESGPIPKDELLRRLNTTVAEAKATLENVSTANLRGLEQDQIKIKAYLGGLFWPQLV